MPLVFSYGNTTYCEETINDYEPNSLFYNISHCSYSSLYLHVTAIVT